MSAELFHLTPPELAALDRNHARLAAIGDRGRTRDLFAEHGGEDLVLTSQLIRTPAAAPAAGPSTSQLSLL